MTLHKKILLGLVLGALAGVSTNLVTGGGSGTRRLVTLVTEPIGKMWLAALIMVVIPLIVSTLSLGVAGLGSLRRLGRIGFITILSFLSLTALATILGLVVMNTLRPGQGRRPAETAEGFPPTTNGSPGWWRRRPWWRDARPCSSGVNGRKPGNRPGIKSLADAAPVML